MPPITQITRQISRSEKEKSRGALKRLIIEGKIYFEVITIVEGNSKKQSNREIQTTIKKSKGIKLKLAIKQARRRKSATIMIKTLHQSIDIRNEKTVTPIYFILSFLFLLPIWLPID